MALPAKASALVAGSKESKKDWKCCELLLVVVRLSGKFEGLRTRRSI